MTVRATTVLSNNDSINHLRDYKDVHIDTIPKLNYQISEQLVSILNATVTYAQAVNYGYYDNATGQWGGMLGMLLRDEADYTATAWWCNLFRLPYLQYVSLTTPTRFRLLFISPNLSVTDNVFLLPFHWVSSRRRKRNVAVRQQTWHSWIPCRLFG